MAQSSWSKHQEAAWDALMRLNGQEVADVILEAIACDAKVKDCVQAIFERDGDGLERDAC